MLQLINLVPSQAVDVHLIVEACEERLDEQKVDELLKIVSAHFPPKKS